MLILLLLQLLINYLFLLREFLVYVRPLLVPMDFGNGWVSIGYR